MKYLTMKVQIQKFLVPAIICKNKKENRKHDKNKCGFFQPLDHKSIGIKRYFKIAVLYI